MSDLVQFTTDKDVAIITINNPPVNALSRGVPEGIEAAIARINSDDSIKAAVLIGGGKTFIAGADINMFVEMTSGKGGKIDLLPTLLKIEDCRKPVVVALHGNALGGGLEVAQACHYRADRSGHSRGAAGSESRNHSRRGRHAAFAASCWHRESRRDVHHGQAGNGGRGARSRNRRQDRRGRLAGGRNRICARNRRQAGAQDARAHRETWHARAECTHLCRRARNRPQEAARPPRAARGHRRNRSRYQAALRQRLPGRSAAFRQMPV